MASLRPVSRVLTRITTITFCTSQISRPIHHLHPFLQLNTTHKSSLHTSCVLLRSEIGSTGRPIAGSSTKSTTPPTDPASNDAYPDGPPGQPKPGETIPSGISPSTLYNFEELQSIASAPASYPHKLIIDVREPGELLDTGRIPHARNIPIKTAADAFFLNEEDFEDRYGFARPGEDKEVIFYCKAGVRSRAAARLAGQAGFGGKVGEFPGSMDEWLAKGGEVQRE